MDRYIKEFLRYFSGVNNFLLMMSNFSRILHIHVCCINSTTKEFRTLGQKIFICFVKYKFVRKSLYSNIANAVHDICKVEVYRRNTTVQY